MLRAKQRKLAGKQLLSPAGRVTNSRTPILSASSKTLRKVSTTNWLIVCLVISLVFLVCILLKSSSPAKPSTSSKLAQSSPHTYTPGIPKIYVSIATLGDHACPITVNGIFNQAKFPQNIFIGIYQQNDASDPDCLDFLSSCPDPSTLSSNSPIMHETLGDISITCKLRSQIVINRTTIALGAKGPVYGRYMSMFLKPARIAFDFICMIDSHTVFRSDWDDYTLRMLFSIQPDPTRAVLTHYPWGAEHLEKRIQEGNEYSYHICGSVYEGAPNFMVRNANGCFAKNAKIPVRMPFFAGGFSFAPSQFWKDVPLDPYLLYIFNGEEFDIATRGWTHGYDFYSPHTDIVGHYYDKGPKRRSPHVGSNKESHGLRDKSEKRLNYMWGLWAERYPQDKDLKLEEIAEKCELRDLAKYGLGTERRLEAFWKWAGIDPLNKTITIFKEEYYAQGGLPYVSY